MYERATWHACRPWWCRRARLRSRTNAVAAVVLEHDRVLDAEVGRELELDDEVHEDLDLRLRLEDEALRVAGVGALDLVDVDKVAREGRVLGARAGLDELVTRDHPEGGHRLGVIVVRLRAEGDLADREAEGVAVHRVEVEHVHGVGGRGLSGLRAPEETRKRAARKVRGCHGAKGKARRDVLPGLVRCARKRAPSLANKCQRMEPMVPVVPLVPLRCPLPPSGFEMAWLARVSRGTIR